MLSYFKNMWKDLTIERLRKSKFKLTPQRFKLIEVIEKIGQNHPTIGEVYEQIKSDFPTMSFSTLYSNILNLKELNLLELLNFFGKTRIEINVRPHINILENGIVKDLNDDELIEKIEEKIGKKVKIVNVIVESTDLLPALKDEGS